MEIFVILLLSGFVTAKVVTTHREEMQYARQGIESPRWKAKRSKGLTPKRPGMSGYVAELWADAWDDARAQHQRNRELREQAKDQAHERTLNGEQAAPEATSTAKGTSRRKRLRGWLEWAVTPVGEETPTQRKERAERHERADPHTCEGCGQWSMSLYSGLHRGRALRLCLDCIDGPAHSQTDPVQEHDCRGTCPACGNRGVCEEVPGGPINGSLRHEFWHITGGKHTLRCPADPQPTECGRCTFPVNPIPDFWSHEHGDYRHPACAAADARDHTGQPGQPAAVCDGCGRQFPADQLERIVSGDFCAACATDYRTATTPQPQSDTAGDTPAPVPAEGRHRADGGAATGDIADVNDCAAQCEVLLDDLNRIDTQLDEVDTAVKSAAAAGERMAGWLASKNAPQVHGLDEVVGLLSPDVIKTLIEVVAAAKQGVHSTEEKLVPLREAAEKVGAADGSATNGR